MAKERHDQETPSSSGATLAILVAGIVLVAGLIVWAMTRTVEPDPIATETASGASPSTPVAAAPTTSPTDTGFAQPQPVPGATAAVPPPQQAAPPAGGDRSTVTRIAAEDLRAKLNRNEVTVLDVRDGAAYAMEHIPGAISTPFASLEAQIATLPKGKPIVTYCT